MKKIMILGAGVYQVPLIKKAKEIGLHTIVVSIPGNYPGFKYADEVVYEDTTDTDGVLKIAREMNIDGICTTGTDVAISTLGVVCDELGLCGVSSLGARYACDKMLMKRAFAEHNVKTAGFKELNIEAKDDTLEEVCEELGYPVIFKAVDSSGSRGIVRVNSKEDISDAIKSVRSVTKVDHFIIEKFLIGTEFGAQAFVYKGRLEFVIPHGDIVYTGDTGVPIGHYAPYGSENLIEETKSELAKAVEAMHIDNCAINADFILCDDGVYVLEIGARGGATCLVELVSIYYGYDYYEKIIRAAMGEEVTFKPENEKRIPNASHLLMSDKTGSIVSIQNNNTVDDGVYEIVFDHVVGERVNKFHIGPDRIGHVVVYDQTIDGAMARLKEVMDNIHIAVKPD